MVSGFVYRSVDFYNNVIYRNRAGELHRTDGPAVIEMKGFEAWYLNDKCHRVDGPAVVFTNGSEQWCQHGELHRVDGPAVVDVDGTEEYWIEGKQLKQVKKKGKKLVRRLFDNNKKL